MKKKINWVCSDCAKERGASQPDGHIGTWNINICDLCNKEKEVTEPRDYGRTRHLIEN